MAPLENYGFAYSRGNPKKNKPIRTPHKQIITRSESFLAKSNFEEEFGRETITIGFALKSRYQQWS